MNYGNIVRGFEGVAVNAIETSVQLAPQEPGDIAILKRAIPHGMEIMIPVKKLPAQSAPKLSWLLDGAPVHFLIFMIAW